MSSLSDEGAITDSEAALAQQWNRRQIKLQITMVDEPPTVEGNTPPVMMQEDDATAEPDHILEKSTNEKPQNSMVAEPPTTDDIKLQKLMGKEDVKAEPHQISEISTDEMNPYTSPTLANVNEFGDEYFPINEQGVYFDIVLLKRNVKPLYMMDFPEEIHPKLPSSTVPATIYCNGKSWTTRLVRDIVRLKLESATWRRFVTDTKLKAGDCLVFEIMEESAEGIKFRVQILRCDFPPELEAD